MPNSPQIQKRIKQNKNRRALNRWRKLQYRSAIKEYHELILHGSVDDAKAKLDEIYKLLDRTAVKGAIHRNKAARQKSRLAARLNAKAAA